MTDPTIAGARARRPGTQEVPAHGGEDDGRRRRGDRARGVHSRMRRQLHEELDHQALAKAGKLIEA
jgi:hypothetical protein